MNSLFSRLRFPEERPPVREERRHELGEHALAEAIAVHGEVQEADVGELLPRPRLAAAVLGVHDETPDLRRPVEVVADGEHLVPEVPVDRGRVVLALGHVEEGAR
jgi:hypothetical protein